MFPRADTINGVQIDDEIGKATIGEHLDRLPIIIDDEIEASLSSADSVHVLLKILNFATHLCPAMAEKPPCSTFKCQESSLVALNSLSGKEA
ncbi:hypothetical protein L1987_45159 [Smallanthus sonchifolius]|uniref:Uncharacterized protein n=1 Tax=Smallanthus sonchifolius TaxID=185202 RepID=A0ACB9GRK1_9ASTR|nr:hypothetical protein L1987_45159 [Smallanthus sonchifolius]